jgi:hypothetical protein
MIDLKILKSEEFKQNLIYFFKLDGIICKIEDNIPFTFQQDDNSSNWFPLDSNNTEHKYLLEGFSNLEFKLDGFYYCIGPKIKNNSHKEVKHIFIPCSIQELKFDIKEADSLLNDPYSYFKNLFKNFVYPGLIIFDEEYNLIGEITREFFGYTNHSYSNISHLLNKNISVLKFYKIIDNFISVAENYHSYETESAPSGEWEEYNYGYLILEEEYHTYIKLMSILGIKIEEVFDKENNFLGVDYEF